MAYPFTLRHPNRLRMMEGQFLSEMTIVFWKKPSSKSEPSDSASQSQTLSNATITGSSVQMGQAGGDLQQQQTADLQTQQHGITGADVVALLEKLEAAVNESSLDAAQKEELLDYLRPAKREAGKETPSKDLMGQNLKQVSETLKTLNETTEAGKSLWKTGVEVFKAVAPWLGIALSVFGL